MLGLKLNHVNKRGYWCCVVQWSTSPQINSNICHAVASYVQILHHGWLLTLSVFIWATCPERNQVITQSMIRCKELQWQMFLIAVVWIRLKCTRMWHSVSNYTPRFNEVERGVYWYHLVRLSVCGQNRVRSVSSTILIGSISYLHILSSNFRRCVACNARFKI